MPTENWYPISGATHDLPSGHDAFTLVSGTNKNDATRPGGGRAGPATHDDDTSCIGEETINENQALNIDWPGPIGTLGSGTFFNANFRHRAVVGAVHRQAFFVNAGGSSGSSWGSVNDSTTSYVSTGPTDVSSGATYRPGGGSWVVSDFADDRTVFGRLSKVGAADAEAFRCTSVWGDMTYNPPSGGFAFLLNLAGLGALPFVGRITDIAQFRSYLTWRHRFHPRHTIMTDDEVTQAWRELREYRHPTFYMPRVA